METLLGKSGYKRQSVHKADIGTAHGYPLPIFFMVWLSFSRVSPLIDHDDHPFTCFVGKTSIRLSYSRMPSSALRPSRPLRTVNGTHGTHNRIFLRIFIDFSRLTHTSCINHGENSCPSASVKWVSMASRVVPATGLTITRSSPKWR